MRCSRPGECSSQFTGDNRRSWEQIALEPRIPAGAPAKCRPPPKAPDGERLSLFPSHRGHKLEDRLQGKRGGAVMSLRHACRPSALPNCCRGCQWSACTRSGSSLGLSRSLHDGPGPVTEQERSGQPAPALLEPGTAETGRWLRPVLAGARTAAVGLAACYQWGPAQSSCGPGLPGAQQDCQKRHAAPGGLNTAQSRLLRRWNSVEPPQPPGGANSAAQAQCTGWCQLSYCVLCFSAYFSPCACRCRRRSWWTRGGEWRRGAGVPPGGPGRLRGHAGSLARLPLAARTHTYCLICHAATCWAAWPASWPSSCSAASRS